MLQTIREHTQGWIAGTIISIIILTFALWGIHSYFIGGANTHVVVTINGVEITKEQLTMAYERLRRQAQTQYGIPVTGKDESALKDRALKTLIDVEVLKQASAQQGFKISNEQIDNYLQSMPEFQVDGQFSLDRFQEVISSTLMSTGEFLELIRTSLLIDQPRLGILLTSFSLPDETAYTISLVNQERDIAYITIPLQFFLSQPIIISPDQIKAYYDTHQSDFMTPEQMNVEYIQLSLKDLAAKFNPTDAEEKFANQRDQLAEMTYEHPDSLQAAAKALNLPIQTSELFTKDKAGKDISQYKKVRDMAFSNDVLNLQNNSDVIQLNPDTVIVLRVKSHIASTLLPLKDITKKIEDKLKTEEAEKRAANFAADLMTKLQAGADPRQLANSSKLTWIKTGHIGHYSTKVDPAILDIAFRLPNPVTVQKKVVYGKTRLPNGYAIVALNAVKPGVAADSKQSIVFAEQVQNSEGLLEYQLYRHSQTHQAKIELQ